MFVKNFQLKLSQLRGDRFNKLLRNSKVLILKGVFLLHDNFTNHDKIIKYYFCESLIGQALY